MSALLHPSVVLYAVLADADVDPEVEEKLTPGWIGAFVIVGLIVVTVLLWLSMRRQFGRIRFPEQDQEQQDGDGDGGGDGDGDRPSRA